MAAEEPRTRQTDIGSNPGRIVEKLKKENWQVACAESCTIHISEPTRQAEIS